MLTCIYGFEFVSYRLDWEWESEGKTIDEGFWAQTDNLKQNTKQHVAPIALESFRFVFLFFSFIALLINGPEDFCLNTVPNGHFANI